MSPSNLLCNKQHYRDLDLTKPMSAYTIYAGLFSTKEAWTGEAQAMSVAKVIRNPNWIGLDSEHGDDIALIEVCSTVIKIFYM